MDNWVALSKCGGWRNAVIGGKRARGESLLCGCFPHFPCGWKIDVARCDWLSRQLPSLLDGNVYGALHTAVNSTSASCFSWNNWTIATNSRLNFELSRELVFPECSSFCAVISFDKFPLDCLYIYCGPGRHVSHLHLVCILAILDETTGECSPCLRRRPRRLR